MWKKKKKRKKKKRKEKKEKGMVYLWSVMLPTEDCLYNSMHTPMALYRKLLRDKTKKKKEKEKKKKSRQVIKYCH